MVLLLEHLDAINNGSCPFNNEVLEPIPLVQVGVHELLHGLPWQPVLFTLLVVLGLLCVDVND